ncbi:hypothetical protein [Sandaracinus amylolyticus]|nr:hypothetical protein [Sandaracinus amylolyticus]
MRARHDEKRIIRAADLDILAAKRRFRAFPMTICGFVVATAALRTGRPL